jgi:hypothetical protein
VAEPIHRERPHVIEVIPYERTIRYPSVPDASLPPRPEEDVRPAGFLGLGINRQDQSHHRRMTEIYHLGVEAALAEDMANAIEVRGVKQATEAMAKAEEIVYAQPQDSVAGMLGADLAGDMAARIRSRHARIVETFEAEASNILHRR